MATSAHVRCRCRGDVQSQPDRASSALGRRTRMQARGAALTLRWASPAAYCQEANELRAAKKALLRTATDDLAEMCSLRQVPWPCGVHRSHHTRTSLLALLASPAVRASLTLCRCSASLASCGRRCRMCARRCARVQQVEAEQRGRRAADVALAQVCCSGTVGLTRGLPAGHAAVRAHRSIGRRSFVSHPKAHR